MFFRMSKWEIEIVVLSESWIEILLWKDNEEYLLAASRKQEIIVMGNCLEHNFHGHLSCSKLKLWTDKFIFLLYISWRRRQFMMWHILSSYNVTCQKLHSSSNIDMKTIETQHDTILNDIIANDVQFVTCFACCQLSSPSRRVQEVVLTLEQLV